KTMFHVEHTPIQILPTLFGSALKQAKTVRVDQLQWQDFGELGGTTCVLAIDTDVVVGLPTASNTNLAGVATRQKNLAKDSTAILLVLNNGLQSGTAEGSGEAKNMNGLKQAGLATAVRTG